MRVRIEDWGEDHYSTLVYIESRVVDDGGKLNHQHMRKDGKKYPTRLKDGTTLTGHSDWDCLEDIVDSGLAVDEGRWYLTDEGWFLAGLLRRYLAEQGNYKGFDTLRKRELRK